MQVAVNNIKTIKIQSINNKIINYVQTANKMDLK